MEKLREILNRGVYSAPISERFFALTDKVSPAEFKNRFLRKALDMIRFNGNEFTVDEFNKDIINQLYYYLVGNSNLFKGDLNRGIMLIGPYGTGKTVLMESFLSCFNGFTNKRVLSISSREIFEILKEKGPSFLNKRPLFIDDVGKEHIIVNDFGTKVIPFEDIVAERYKKGAITFGTSNLTLDDMPYHLHTKDRLQQMFNYLILSGKTRRK